MHTHTIFCDGKTDVETMCQQAFARGFESIGFSAHAHITKKTGIKSDFNLPDEKLPQYIDAVLDARKHWKDKLGVYLGLEVDYIEGLCGPADADIRELPLDYVIGAVHYLAAPKNQYFFTVDGPPEEFNPGFEQFDNDGIALCRAYYDAYQKMVSTGSSDILAHLDLVKKNNERRKIEGRTGFLSYEDPEYIKLSVETADAVAAVRAKAIDGKTANGMIPPIVEVNTGGMVRAKMPEPAPGPAILRLLAARNIPLIVNADAHAPEHLGGAYTEAWELMRQAGYGKVMLPQGVQDGKIAWREESL
jgi:histidinol-phosphatase (PHP family)